MRILMVIVASLAFGWSNQGSTISVPYPLQNRVKDADVIVIGTLTNVVRDRFSIVYHNYLGDPGEEESIGRADHEYIYDAGELMVDEVLKGRLLSYEKYVAFASGYRRSPADKGYPGMKPGKELAFHEGQHGIWILRKNRVFLSEYLGATYADGVVPLDSLEAVKEYVVRNRYVDTTRK